MKYVIAYRYRDNRWNLWDDSVVMRWFFSAEEIKEKLRSELIRQNKEGVFAEYVVARIINNKKINAKGWYLILYRARTGENCVLNYSNLHDDCSWPGDEVKAEIQELRRQKRLFAVARVIDFDIKVVLKR